MRKQERVTVPARGASNRVAILSPRAPIRRRAPPPRDRDATGTSTTVPGRRARSAAGVGVRLERIDAACRGRRRSGSRAVGAAPTGSAGQPRRKTARRERAVPVAELETSGQRARHSNTHRDERPHAPAAPARTTSVDSRAPAADQPGLRAGEGRLSRKRIRARPTARTRRLAPVGEVPGSRVPAAASSEGGGAAGSISAPRGVETAVS